MIIRDWSLRAALTLVAALLLPLPAAAQTPVASISDFVTVWEVSGGDLSITIPTEGDGYDYTVDWGDGTASTGHTGDAGHRYAAGGEYTVRISGDFPRIHVDGGDAKDNIREVRQWGDQGWTSMASAFWSVRDFRITARDHPDLSNVASMANMFRNAANFNSDIGGWDVSNVQNMANMFRNAGAFNGDLGGWDVSGATRMNNMFRGATLSTANYDALLQGWSALASLQSGVNFHAGNSRCSDAGRGGKAILTSAPNDWVITDGGCDLPAAPLEPTLTAAPTLSYPEPPANPRVGDAVSLTATASDFTGAITYSDNGDLPGGLSLNGATGAISGKLTTAAGAFAFTITATDGADTATADIDFPAVGKVAQVLSAFSYSPTSGEPGEPVTLAETPVPTHEATQATVSYARSLSDYAGRAGDVDPGGETAGFWFCAQQSAK